MKDPQARSEPTKIGSDQVVHRGEQLVVYSRAEMPDWSTRKYRRVGIVFEGRRFYVSRRMPQHDGWIRYLLDPWPGDSPEDPVFEITYDEEYVRVRDRNSEAARMARRAEPLVLILFPLIGLLPSKIKARLHDRHGIDARAATEWSLWAEYLAIFAAICLLTIHIFTGIFHGALLIGAIVVLIPDTVIRYNDCLGESMAPYGFYEWLFRLRLK